MKLKIGKMTQKELAEWFGISASYMRKESAKKKYYELLKCYAEYHFETAQSGGQSIIIDHIYIDEFQKPESPFNIILARFNEFWSPTKLDTLRHVAKKFLKAYPEWTIQLDTCCSYVGRAKVLLYGHNYKNDHGEQGRSRFEWAQLNRKTFNFEKLPQEHRDIISTINREVYSGLTEEISKLIFANAQGQISTIELEEGIKAQIKELKSEYYETFLTRINESLGYIPDCVTEIIQENYFEKEE